ncbi:MAG TPA: GNAT family N-acetyltransferase [Planctomycetota bacterium]|nr:GNAT family N-acetyltransferase [Planctomycetota bacterium]
MGAASVPDPVVVRPAAPRDVPDIARFIRDLARYEKLEHQLDLDAARLHEHLFGASPACGALLAEVGGRAVGFALFFATYSTFRTRPCLHLEDLFVVPEHRGRGAGLALLRAVAAEALRRGCPRLDWNVLDWNVSAIGFYEKQGAAVLGDWRTCRLEGEALRRAASGR